MELGGKAPTAGNHRGKRISVDRLTGDQIGVLLGWYLLGQTEGDRAVATTIVSSSMLSKVAEAAGASCHHTLTGFKWLARTDTPDVPLVFAYEEALGYSVLPSIRDKDGISAGVVFAELVSTVAQFGHTVDEVLKDLSEQHGVHLTSQVSARFEGDDSMAQMTAQMAALRAAPPIDVGGLPVVEAIDLIALAASPLYMWWLADPQRTEYAIAMAVLVWIRHWENIRRLLRGEESKIDRSGKA